jgi:hypothetical protein
MAVAAMATAARRSCVFIQNLPDEAASLRPRWLEVNSS